jgi:RNA polymerase sigma factor (sigma-70 family)
VSAQPPDEQQQERAWVSRLRQGDPAAFDAIYAQHRARVFSFLARMTGRRELAEDLLQETFLRLVRFAPRLAEDTRPGMWLLAVARNLCRSHYRWQFVNRDSLAALSDARVDDLHATPFDLTSARELEREVQRALARLSFEHREILILTAIERVPSDDVARLLELTPEAVRQRLSRARKLLAQLLHVDAPHATPLSRTVTDES